MSSFPRTSDLYEANGATYRRSAYKGDTTQMNKLPTGGDTADLYGDDNYDDEPACGFGECPADDVKPESAKASLEPPPGFERLSVSGSSLPAKTEPALGAADPRVKKEGENRWTASIEVAKNLHGLLIGPQHSTRITMEKATECRISFPSRDDTISTTIRISSAVGAENVARCLDRIDALVISGQKTGRIHRNPTHFVAIPCNYNAVIRGFNTFKDMIMKYDFHESLENDALYPSKFKLHLTICMLALDTDEEKAKAKEIMASISEKYGAMKQLDVEVEKLNYMNDDPRNVHVLFAECHGSYLQEMVDDVKAEFVKAGLVATKDANGSSVKLHMTVMNSRYAVPEETKGPEYRNYKHREPFNVKDLLEDQPNFHFGIFILNRMDICTLQTEDKETGYYECLVQQKIRDIDMRAYLGPLQYDHLVKEGNTPVYR